MSDKKTFSAPMEIDVDLSDPSVQEGVRRYRRFLEEPFDATAVEEKNVHQADHKFHIGDLLSVTTGRILSPRYVDGLYRIVNHMVGERVSARQLTQARKECAVKLLEVMPQLEEVNVDKLTNESFEGWITAQIKRFGERHTVPELPPGSIEFDYEPEQHGQPKGIPREELPVETPLDSEELTIDEDFIREVENRRKEGLLPPEEAPEE